MKRWMIRPFAILTVWSLTFFVPQAVASAVQESDIAAQVDADNLYFDVERLAQTPRIAATETEFAVASYMEDRLRSYGYQTRLQPFYYYLYRAPKTVSLRVGMEKADWKPVSVAFGPNGEGTGPLVACGDGTQKAIRSIELNGKVAFVEIGSLPTAEIVRNVAAAGAVAAILVDPDDDPQAATLGEPLDVSVPVLLLSRTEGRELRDRLQAGVLLQTTVKVEGGVISRHTSYNVEAIRKPTDGNENHQIVVVGAHHDSVSTSPGANDNASGVAALLEAARLLAEEPIDTELRFVSFGASEQGQRGSNAYVQSLPADVKKRISAVFQLERIGSGAAGDLVMDTADGKPNRATELGARAGAVLAKGEKARQKIVSDHLVFAAAGIPAALFHNAPSETWYDQREDTVSQIGKEQLLRATQTVISAVYQLAQP